MVYSYCEASGAYQLIAGADIDGAVRLLGLAHNLQAPEHSRPPDKHLWIYQI